MHLEPQELVQDGLVEIVQLSLEWAQVSYAVI